MEEKIDVAPDSSQEKVEVVSEDVKTPDSTPKVEEKTVPYSRFKEVNDQLDKLKKKPPVVKTSLDVGDYIDISTSLDGLDPREKEYLAKQHTLTGKPLGEIRKDEDFIFWQTAYKQSAEKTKTLAPSSKQPDIDEPLTLEQALKAAQTPAEKEKLLTEAGLYSETRQRGDRVNRR